MCKSDNITFQVHTVQVQYYYTHYTHHITLYIAREAIDHGSNCMFTIFGFGTDVNCLKSDPYFLITSLASTTIMCVKNKDDTSIKRFVQYKLSKCYIHVGDAGKDVCSRLSSAAKMHIRQKLLFEKNRNLKDHNRSLQLRAVVLSSSIATMC